MQIFLFYAEIDRAALTVGVWFQNWDGVRECRNITVDDFGT